MQRYELFTTWGNLFFGCVLFCHVGDYLYLCILNYYVYNAQTVHNNIVIVGWSGTGTEA